MCKDCGCQEGNEKKFFGHDRDIHNHDNHHHDHSHEHGHFHDGHWHSHDSDHEHNHPEGHHQHDHSHDNHIHGDSKTVMMEKNILAKNDEYAHQNKHWLKDRGIVAVNIISSPGSGKTTLLEKTLDALKDKINCSVIVGDQSTDNDAKRLMGKCDCVYQIETKSSCHLDAKQISEILPQVVNDNTKLLFIENVGNLICPAAFELGEDFKIVLLSSTEGEDKPVKYPVIFSDASVAIITKTDLIPHLDWDIKKCRNYIRQVNPGMYIFELSSKTGEGMNSWLEYLAKLVE
ncbi:MAG TPA: hydrogenase accessory protein HypB [Lentisphaeria bacterium]|nr:MAG: hydrogenase accessory protein HypB [Lentisphaerae bacterium GWF2_38_69]HBM15065.1 hydrogenase accessory protein HypB [Lentisphaeria bacterium]